MKTKTEGNCRYKPCGKPFKKRNGVQAHCSQKCLDAEKAEKAANKTAPITTKEKSLSELVVDLQKDINLIVRLIDNRQNCICGNRPLKVATAGHYFSVGSNPTLRFHLLNIWGQEFESNGAKGGEPLFFRDGLANLYGWGFIDRLNALKSISLIDLNANDVKEKISICRGIQKWLKLQDRKFTTAERLHLREKYNAEIGIYK